MSTLFRVHNDILDNPNLVLLTPAEAARVIQFLATIMAGACGSAS
tara:strand:+ start:75520 stop:75654 length:135 start_codon:yes stop_codon:yes gene_type:complete